MDRENERKWEKNEGSVRARRCGHRTRKELVESTGEMN